MASKPIKSKKSKKDSVETLLMLLEKNLSNFTTSKIFEERNREGITENELTSALRFFLENCNKQEKLRFTFETQAVQPESRTADIGVQLLGNHTSSGNYIFLLEAKFLPYSHNDYVIGEYAAIKRFKAIQHGYNNPIGEEKLEVSGIIAYVQKHDFVYHFNKINTKIADLISGIQPDKDSLTWQTTELLQKIYFNEIAKLVSEHTRIDNSKITLHHFWVKVTA
jgi:hypothetical protein